MTLEIAKQIYIAAGGNRGHSSSEWKDIHAEMESIVAAQSDRAAAKVIHWWGCWDDKYTATAFARRVRTAYQQYGP